MTRRNEAHPHSVRSVEVVARRWNVIAVALALATGLGTALLPLGSSSSAQSDGTERTSHVSLLSTEGPSILIVVAIPALLIALPLLFRSVKAASRTRIVIVVLLTSLVLLGALSIGMFFVPTLIAMLVAVSAQRSAIGATRDRSVVAGHR